MQTETHSYDCGKHRKGHYIDVNEYGREYNVLLLVQAYSKRSKKGKIIVSTKPFPDYITKDKTRKKHLEGRWCIIDKNGIEKVNFPQFKYPYLVKDSCIYYLEHKYYNIETGELYCQSYSSMSSKDYLFLNNEFDKDISKRGVLKISKRTGLVESFI